MTTSVVDTPDCRLGGTLLREHNQQRDRVYVIL
jgi:hypothetical protein